MYSGCNLKTTELLYCMLIRACAVIRLNMVYLNRKDTIALDKALFQPKSIDIFLIQLENIMLCVLIRSASSAYVS